MKKLLTLTLMLLSFNTFSNNLVEIPEIPENACYGGCTENIQAMYERFLKADSAPTTTPGMYSGECYYNSPILNADTTHYIGMLIDNDAPGLFMAPILQFFGDANDMKDWSLERARSEVLPEWKIFGKITVHPTSFTAHVNDEEGYPAYIYWARLDRATKRIHFITYMRQMGVGFCEATLNK